MYTKILKITIPVIIAALVISQNTALANHLDFSKGIMPDSPFYSLDLSLEKYQISSKQDNPDQLADLYFQFSTERLDELNYLADSNQADIEEIVVLNANYQDNISNYTKIISEQSDSEQVDKIIPQIQELKVSQNKIVEKITNSSAKDEVKVLVKSSIKESQDSMILALATASKPIIKNSSNESSEGSKDKEVSEKANTTLEELKTSNEEIKKDLEKEEDNLKIKKDEEKKVEQQKNDDTESKPEIEEVAVEDLTTPEPVLEEAVEEVDSPEEIVEVVSEWYYSPSCDYVSAVPGKDPVCGEDMIAVSALDSEHSFFTKYIFKDGKYVQNIDDLAEKETDTITGEIDEINEENDIKDQESEEEAAEAEEKEDIELDNVEMFNIY